MSDADLRKADGAVMTVVKGLLIGLANIIPGVSGGTFALILGIFDRLILALRRLNFATVKVALSAVVRGFNARARADLAEEIERIDLWFLAQLGIGAVAAILGLSFLMDYLLVEHPAVTLAFFIGLILPSILVPWHMMERRTPGALVWLVPGVALTVGVSLAFRAGATGSTSLSMAFVTGAIAVSAMILPGISGSFVMLVMGQYQNVLHNLQGLQRGVANAQIDWAAFVWLAALGVGCIVGLMIFARLLNFVLSRYRSATLAFLIGLILGSFWVLWPFKDYAAGADVAGRKGEVKLKVKVATAPNRLPKSGGELGVCALALVLGLAGAVGVNKLGDTSAGTRQTQDGPGPEPEADANATGDTQ